MLVPDIPESLDIKIKRERYLAKEALQDADQILQKVLTDHESDRVDSGMVTSNSQFYCAYFSEIKKTVLWKP